MQIPTTFRIVLLCIFIFGMPISVNAHDTNIATFQIRRMDSNQWLYELMTPLYSLDQSIRSFNPDKTERLDEIEVGSIEYKQEIVAHIKQGFNVLVTGVDTDGEIVASQALSLGQGRINLDDHMSTLIFEIKGMPEQVEELTFYLNNMSKNPKQMNLLRLIDGDEQQRYSLHSENNFSITVTEFFKHP